PRETLVVCLVKWCRLAYGHYTLFPIMSNIDELVERYRYLQTKYREYREQFTTLRNHFYLIECAWCKRRIRWKRKVPSVPGDTSHGICPPCAAGMLREIAKLRLSPL